MTTARNRRLTGGLVLKPPLLQRNDICIHKFWCISVALKWSLVRVGYVTPIGGGSKDIYRSFGVIDLLVDVFNKVTVSKCFDIFSWTCVKKILSPEKRHHRAHKTVVDMLQHASAISLKYSKKCLMTLWISMEDGHSLMGPTNYLHLDTRIPG